MWRIMRMLCITRKSGKVVGYSMRILTVDDSAVIRKIIRTALGVLEYELLEAQDGMEAFEILEQNQDVDLVLLDWNMPQKSGYEVLTEMKKDPRYAHIPVMMVTTEGERANIVAAVKAGAINYLTKPFKVEELIEKVLECVEDEVIP